MFIYEKTGVREKNVVKTYFRGTTLYRSETWSVNNTEDKKLIAFGTQCCYRWCLK